MKLLVGWLGKALAAILRYMPLRLRLALGDALGILWFDVFRIRRRVVLDNIQKAFSDLSQQERVRLGRRGLRNICRGGLEYGELPFLTESRARTIMATEGEDHLRQALQQGKGVILLTLHLGNGDLAACCLARMGYPMMIVSKSFKWEGLNELWFGLRQRLGLGIIPARNSSYAILKALKQNRILGFPLDQFMGPPIGVKTTFFGHETGTALGLALMAERSGAMVVPSYTYRKSDGNSVVVFEPGFQVLIQGEDRDKGLVAMTQRFNDILEVYVRRYPDQWMWLHRRWKRHLVR